jgi:hypothetical protein
MKAAVWCSLGGVTLIAAIETSAFAAVKYRMSNFLSVERKSVAFRKDQGWSYAVTNDFLGR